MQGIVNFNYGKKMDKHMVKRSKALILSRSTPSFSKNSGFTLVELVIVIVVLGILVAAGIVGLQYWMQEASLAKSQENYSTLAPIFLSSCSAHNTLPVATSYDVTNLQINGITPTMTIAQGATCASATIFTLKWTFSGYAVTCTMTSITSYGAGDCVLS